MMLRAVIALLGDDYVAGLNFAETSIGIARTPFDREAACRHALGPRGAALAAKLSCGLVLAVVGSVGAPVAIRMTALPITSAGRFSPLGPVGIAMPLCEPSPDLLAIDVDPDEAIRR